MLLLEHWKNTKRGDNNRDLSSPTDPRKILDEEEREIEEAEKNQIRLEFSTNIIAAHRYSLRNVIYTGQGFDCEVIYIPRHKDKEDDRYFAKRFKVRVTSKNATIECMEIREGWGGYGEIWDEQYICEDKAEELIKRAMEIASTLINIPEKYKDKERSFFAELAATAAVEDNNNNKEEEEVVKQQEHNHELDLAIAELCADVEVEFLEPRM